MLKSLVVSLACCAATSVVVGHEAEAPADPKTPPDQRLVVWKLFLPGEITDRINCCDRIEPLR